MTSKLSFNSKDQKYSLVTPATLINKSLPMVTIKSDSDNDLLSSQLNDDASALDVKTSLSEQISNSSINENSQHYYEGSKTTSQDHSSGQQRRTRYHVALLGLAIAVVNCYAQATFCIAIVEMVLPADFVFKGESGSQSIVKVVSSYEEIKLSKSVDLATLKDNSCPVEYRYRDYYDSWRFPTNLSADQKQSQSATDNVIDISNRFDWDASRQGLLLGAFAVGTAPLQVLGGRLAEIYGAKWVLLAGCIGTALTNLTIPILAHFSFTLLIINRVVMGIAQAGMEPGLMCLLSQWLTPAETGFFISMLLFAICIGFFLGSLCSSFLLTLGYGWPLTYYVAGGMNLLVAIVWFLYANSRPEESRLISTEEMEYIKHEQQLAKKVELERREKINNDLNEGKDWKQQPLNISTTMTDNIIIGDQENNINESRQIKNLRRDAEIDGDELSSGQAPWMNILRTPPVWAFIICKISIRWCADVLSIELPSYLANVLHLSIKLNGILNSVSSALFAIFSFITGYVVNEILKRQLDETNSSGSADYLASAQVDKKRFVIRVSKTNLRKIIQSIASFGSALAVFLMTRYDCNILLSMSMLLILSCCLVMGTGGELQIPYDMTSRYPGTLHGMACTLSVSGWLAPPLIGLILGDQPSSRYRWNLVWYLTALINLVGGLVFVLFADASPRDFDSPKSTSGKGNRRRQNNNESGGCPGERGRHLASYYNAACKMDSSPPRLRSVKSVEQQTNWSSCFDRELIKCRQVEESFMKPTYLDSLDCIGAQTIMFPYACGKQQVATQQSSLKSTPMKSLNDDDDNDDASEKTISEQSKVWKVWARMRRRRQAKKFVIPCERGQQTGTSSSSRGHHHSVRIGPKPDAQLAELERQHIGNQFNSRKNNSNQQQATLIAPGSNFGVPMETKTITHL